MVAEERKTFTPGTSLAWGWVRVEVAGPSTLLVASGSPAFLPLCGPGPPSPSLCSLAGTGPACGPCPPQILGCKLGYITLTPHPTLYPPHHHPGPQPGLSKPPPGHPAPSLPISPPFCQYPEQALRSPLGAPPPTLWSVFCTRTERPSPNPTPSRAQPRSLLSTWTCIMCPHLPFHPAELLPLLPSPHSA